MNVFMPENYCISPKKENVMNVKRIYAPAVEEQASMLPRLDISDPPKARATLQSFLMALAEQGVQRPTDDRVEEIERTIPGPQGAPEVPVRIYMPKERTAPGPGFINFHMGGFVFGDLEMEHLRLNSMCYMRSPRV
jgi:acetyl esterase/lipase